MSEVPVRADSVPVPSDAPKPAVLTVAFPYAPIGPRAVGGAEVICTQVEAAVARLGFASVVVAHAHSEPCGQLYGNAIPEGDITDALRLQVEAGHQAAIDRACQQHGVALVHMHGLDFHRYRIPEEIPVLVTLHLPPAWYPEAIWSLPGQYTLVCVSETQRRACPPEAQGRVRVVGNGVTLPDAGTLRAEGRYALMLARICEEKNLHTGLDAARRAGMPAILGGEVFPYEAHQRYFEREIRPRLTCVGSAHERRTAEHGSDAPSARFPGAVTGGEKQRMLARAACLLLPSLAPETSSLVAMEALAAGTPVIGMRVGAVPEIVTDGVTGFLIDPGEGAAEAMAEAIHRLPALDRAACRREAEERFPLHRMLDGYCKLYGELARTNPQPHCGLSGQLGRNEDSPSAAEEFTSQNTLVERIAQDTALEELASEWQHLWTTDGTATPFQHPAWLVPWWRQFGPDGELQAVALRSRSDRALVGLAPFYVYTDPETRRRKLLLAGAGTSDYLGGVWLHSNAEAARLALDHALTSDRCCWDELALQQLGSSSPLLAAGKLLGYPQVEAEACSFVPTRSALPPKLRANLNRYRRRAGGKGDLRCTVASTPEQALAAFDALVELHGQRWRERGEEGVLADARVLAQHRESLPLLLAADLLCLFHLQLGGETLGVLYGLQDGAHVRERKLYLYLIGFDLRHAALSPGTLLVGEAWEYAAEHGFAGLDLLRGGESYKQLWGASAEPTYALQGHVPHQG